MASLAMVFGLALLAAAPEAPAEPPAPESAGHYLVTFRGQTIGKAVRRLERAGAGEAARLKLSVEENYRFSTGERGAGQFALRRQAVMLSDWTPLEVSETSEGTGGEPRAVRFEPGKAFFKLPDGTEKAVEFKGACVAELSGEALAARGLLKPGGTLAALVPDLPRQGLALLRAEVLGEKQIEGSPRKLFLVQVKDADGNAVWDQLVDESGRLEESSTGEMVRRRVEPALAVLPDRPAALMAGLVPLDGAPQKPWKLEKLVVELTLPEDATRLVPEIAGQKASAAGRRVTVTLVARHPDGRLPPEELSGKARALALAPENEPDWKDPEIQKLAAGICQDADSDLKRGFLIARWVHRNLRKTLGGPPEASALQALRQRGGDCSEHAALFAALGRAASLPARTVWGLVADERGLHFHVWSECHAGGSWVPLDATLGRFGLPACYLALSYDREEAGVRLWRLYSAARGRVVNAEETPAK